MFDRKRYKKIARLQLNGRRTVTVLASLVVLALAYLLIVPGGRSAISRGDAARFRYLILLLWAFVWGSVFLAYTYLFTALSHTTEVLSFKVFVRGFSHWLTGLLAYLWNFLWVTLWSALFVIPGIVKSYAYSQMYFVLAENPGIGVGKAMDISKVLTFGHKSDLFIMDLSFIGYLILSALTGGIFFLWAGPYIMMAKTNAYHDMKDEAIRSGRLKKEDFGE